MSDTNTRTLTPVTFTYPRVTGRSRETAMPVSVDLTAWVCGLCRALVAHPNEHLLWHNTLVQDVYYVDAADMPVKPPSGLSRAVAEEMRLEEQDEASSDHGPLTRDDGTEFTPGQYLRSRVAKATERRGQ